MPSGKLPASMSSMPALSVPPSGTGTALSLWTGSTMPMAAEIADCPCCSWALLGSV